MERIDIAAYVFGSILLLANKLQIWGDELIDGMTLKQWFQLLLISKMDVKNPTIKEIAEFSGTSRQNAKQILEQLEKKGYVNTNKSASDARAVSVTLTQKTFDYCVENEEKSNEALSQLFADVTDDELTSTIRTLEKVLMTLGHPPQEVFK